MSAPAIRTQELGKEFRLVEPAERYPTLRGALAGVLRRAWRPAGGGKRFWAVRDVSIEARAGEAVGLIGRNGAGKSTLLKLLTRITEPTTGRAELRGRVGSLLEVGTGFHPELTGRENVHFNGAVLGMRRAEIARRFDEIVAFAGVEPFLDTPAKHYSSGMVMRLAFAVAAHLDTEILLVDEALAVGDAEFQRRCLGKMHEVARGGRAVVFVSHSMDAVQRLCTRAVWLDHGRVEADGPVTHVVADYLGRSGAARPAGVWVPLAEATRAGHGGARFAAVRFASDAADAAFQPYADGPLEVEVRVTAERAMEVGSLAVTIFDRGGAKLVNADTLRLGRRVRLRAGETRLATRIEALHLNPGRYILGLWLADAAGSPYDYVESALDFEVVPRVEAALGVTPSSDGVVPCRFDVRVLHDGPDGDAA